MSINEKMGLLEKIQSNSHEIMLNAEEMMYLTNAFPLILVCNSKADDKIYGFSFSSQEYRSYEPLTLGVEIDVIATDTEEHKKTLVDYF